MENSVDKDQTAPIRAVCSGSMLFASINSSENLGSYLQQTTQPTTFSDAFLFGALRVKTVDSWQYSRRKLHIGSKVTLQLCSNQFKDFELHNVFIILGNPGVAHSVPTAFIMG